MVLSGTRPGPEEACTLPRMGLPPPHCVRLEGSILRGSLEGKICR